MRVEISERVVVELLVWLRRQEGAYEVTAGIFEEEREVTDWFSRQVAEEARGMAREMRQVREGLERQLKGE